MDFDKRLDKKMDRISNQLVIVQNALEEIPENETISRQKLEKKIQALQHKIEYPPKYEPQKYDFYTVYLWVCLYKKLLQFYISCPHFICGIIRISTWRSLRQHVLVRAWG